MNSKNEFENNNPINNDKKKKKKETFESETCENSVSDNAKIKIRQFKRSVDFFPKKMEIDGIDEDPVKRRNTIAMCGNIKNFVPQIRPIKIDIIPSKLRLNKIGFKDLKCNKNNKVLLYANKYFISCPNIQDEEYNDEYDYENLKFYDKINVNSSSEIIPENKNEDINQTRKNLEITKKKIQKVCSVNNPHFKNKYNKELNMGGCDSDSDLYDIDESINNSINETNEDNFKINITNNEEENNKKRDRYNSWSILDILQKKNHLDKK